MRFGCCFENPIHKLYYPEKEHAPVRPNATNNNSNIIIISLSLTASQYYMHRKIILIGHSPTFTPPSESTIRSPLCR